MSEPIKLKNRRVGVVLNKQTTHAYVPRLYHNKRKGKRDAYYLIKCGCCEEKFKVYYGDDTLEIAGVFAPINVWKKILMPLLNYKETQ